MLPYSPSFHLKYTFAAMEDLLRGPGPAFAYVPTIGLLSTLCLAWLAYRSPLPSPRARWENVLLFLVGCFSVFAFLLVGCVFFALANQGDPAWNRRLWKWDVLGIILIDSLYVIRAPLSRAVTRHVPTPVYFHNILDSLWFASCLVLFESLFLSLSFISGQWTQLVAACFHCLWTVIWCWDLKRGVVAVVQLIATVTLGLGHDFLFLLFLTLSSFLFVTTEQWRATQCGDGAGPFESLHTTNVSVYQPPTPPARIEAPYTQSNNRETAGSFAIAYPSRPICVCLLGPGACGKTTLLDDHFVPADGRFSTGKPHCPTLEDTIYASCQIGEKEERIEILDTGDWHTYSEVVDQWIGKAAVCIVPFFNQDSFNAIKVSTLPQKSKNGIFILFASRNRTNRKNWGEEEEEKAVAFAEERGWLYRREVDGSPFTQAIAALKDRRTDKQQ
ncbi:hypothetical protein PG995_004621 [Apiospora arundinis]